MSVDEKDASFEAYSYRVSARFGSRVQIVVGNNTVTISGPRLSPSVYRLWIAVQAVLLTLVVLALLGTLIFWDWRGLMVALLLLLAHLAVSGFGAGCLWEMANLTAFIERMPGETVAFPLDTVKRIKVGSGWARRGMWLLILPYVTGINSLAEGFCVSFEAPDGQPNRQVVYALHMQSRDEARTFAGLLGESAENG
jgi:hypothetical protein